MTAAPLASEFDTRTNATYEALMWALSRPGLIRTLPLAGLAQIIDTLIDRECAVYCEDAALTAQAMQTGAVLAPPEQADHLFLTALEHADFLTRLPQGSDLHPEAAATLVCTARLGRGPRLRLTGPGCDGAVEVQIDGLPDGFWQTRAQVLRYPLGFELFLVDANRVLGLPRSTKVEVL